ncbi:MAG: glcg protein [Nitrospiraceae bacterium]|nr:glcg protein [Nitrospiraceae bacterium]
MTQLLVMLAALAMLPWSGPSVFAEPISDRLTTADVYIALQAAEVKANQIGVPMGITVTDAHGDVRGFLKMDGTFVHVQDTSFSKAYTAVSLRQPTGALPPSVANELGSITQGRLTNLKGGIPIAVDGVIIGGVGVGGGIGNEDEVVARAGAEAVVKKKKR